MTQANPMTVREQMKAWGMSERYVKMARAVQRERPDLFALIGNPYTVNMAYDIMRDEAERGEISGNPKPSVFGKYRPGR